MDNKELRQIYDEMHSQGSTAWFSNGEEERELILKMGEPWKEKGVIEIGCGEGELATRISLMAMYIHALDYSEIAIVKATLKYPMYSNISWEKEDYKNKKQRFDRIVMQGVLEHLDDPFTELKWMMDNLLEEKGDVITSSPCFLNPRGIVWMTLEALGAIMSKTDLHFLNPWDFVEFVKDNNLYSFDWNTCDRNWGSGTDMIKDFRQRLPLALKDGKIPYDPNKLDDLIKWLSMTNIYSYGATAVYRIKK